MRPVSPVVQQSCSRSRVSGLLLESVLLRDLFEGGLECVGVGELECLGGVELVGAGGVDEAFEAVGGAPQVAAGAELSAAVGQVGLGAVAAPGQGAALWSPV